MVAGFKREFVIKIQTNQKKHTIRGDSKNRWKAGMKIHMATGVRTKNYNQFHEEKCISTQRIEIIRTSDYFEDTIVKIDDRALSQSEIKQLAINDGFDNLIHFWLWFKDGFEGKIIHWTDLRY